jgi:hypothetical protein
MNQKGWENYVYEFRTYGDLNQKPKGQISIE